MSERFRTDKGDLTRYALACGYVQIKGKARLEQISSNGALRVSWSDGHSFELFRTLKEARAKLRKVGREG